MAAFFCAVCGEGWTQKTWKKQPCPRCENTYLRAKLAAAERRQWKVVADALTWAINPRTLHQDVVEKIDRCQCAAIDKEGE